MLQWKEIFRRKWKTEYEVNVKEERYHKKPLKPVIRIKGKEVKWKITFKNPFNG